MRDGFLGEGERQQIVHVAAAVRSPAEVIRDHRRFERIGELWRDKKIDGIAALRDESDRSGYRVVIELRRDAMADIVLNQLYRYTALQSTFGANMVALEGGRPLVMAKAMPALARACTLVMARGVSTFSWVTSVPSTSARTRLMGLTAQSNPRTGLAKPCFWCSPLLIM